MDAPFRVLRVPVLRLKAPRVPSVSPPLVLLALVASYWLVTSGIIYDMIMEPPSVGSVRDPATGKWKPEAIAAHRLNGQYIIEGLTAGALFCLGGGSLMLLDQGLVRKFQSPAYRYVALGAGLVGLLTAYLVCITFLKIKFPGYRAI